MLVLNELQGQEASVLIGRLRPPCCYQQTLDIHESPIASALREEIRERIAAGETQSAIETHMVARYGDRIRASPNETIVENAALILVFVAVFSAIGLLFLLLRWSRQRIAEQRVPATASLRDKYDDILDDELRNID